MPINWNEGNFSPSEIDENVHTDYYQGFREESNNTPNFEYSKLKFSQS